MEVLINEGPYIGLTSKANSLALRLSNGVPKSKLQPSIFANSHHEFIQGTPIFHIAYIDLEDSNEIRYSLF